MTNTKATPSPAPMVEQAGELKPCPNPWCTATTKPIPAHMKREGWRVICACGVSTFRQETEALAIAVWNTRPAPAETEEAIMPVLRTAYACGYTDRPGERGWDDNADRLRSDLQTALASTPPADAGMLREALVDLESAGSNVLKAMDSYNEANGTALGGAPFIVLGRRIAAARAALNSQAHQIREGDHG